MAPAAASPSAAAGSDGDLAQPAHLEWHNSEAKWRAKEPPKRVIVLKVGGHNSQVARVGRKSQVVVGQ